MSEIRADAMMTRAKYTPFEGRPVPGRLKHVLLRGRQIAANGQPCGEPGGVFLRPVSVASGHLGGR